jgi:hypothetical protein
MWRSSTYSVTDCRMCFKAVPQDFVTGETLAAVVWTGLDSCLRCPPASPLVSPKLGFGDMSGDGRADLLVHSGSLPGFFETTPNGTWQTFKPYNVFPSFDLADPNVRLVDLTGNGSSDALMTRDEHFLWFECLGGTGFAPPKSIARTHDLDDFPDVLFDDPAGRVRLADMTGSGLNDIVLIHNGRIDYWPILGYGRFGKRITMENAPASSSILIPNVFFWPI